MQLRQPKTFGMFNDDNAGFRHIDANLDNGCRHQQLCAAIAEPVHRLIALGGFHLAMCQRHRDIGQGPVQCCGTFFGSCHIHFFRFFDQRAYPVGPSPGCNGAVKPRHNIAKPVKW